MNVYAGGLSQCGLFPIPLPWGPQKYSDIRCPSLLFVFADEHPDSLDFVSFWVEDKQTGSRNWGAGSCPSSLHGGGGTLSFADGHVELHKWIDERTKPAVTYSTRLNFNLSGDNPDIRWLQERTYQGN
jgi:prepilin-type processing-associated H-X9-DG protein